MDEYFAATLTNLNSNFYSELNLVIGNESCDLDSAVSAIVYSCFLNWQYNQIKCKVCTKIHRDENVPIKDDIFVPILNVDRKDYELKTEVAFYLRKKGIFESNLVFRDDHDLKQLIGSSKTKVILVDHHVLATNDQFLVPYVSEIIDHRPIDRAAWIYKDDTRSTVETVGSCCTLIAQRIKDLGSLVAKDVDFFNAYPICSEMLHATIVLDTVNFSKELNKATPHDEEIILFLESLLKPADYKAVRSNELDTLVAARSDVSKLTAAQLLRKDVKTVGDVLVPSFPILVKDFLKLPGALAAVSGELAARACAVCVLLGMDLTRGLRRDAALYSPRRPETAVMLSKYLEECTSPSLGLSPEILADASECCYYWQLNLSASRKQYMPVIAKFIKSQK